jgi:uncharacterized protein (TIGR02611 family)
MVLGGAWWTNQRATLDAVADLRQVVQFITRNSKRTAVMVVGMLLLVAGVALLVLPGPGLLLIAAGLAVLGTEFVWAERALDTAKRGATGAGQLVGRKVRRVSRGSGAGDVGRSDPPA